MTTNITPAFRELLSVCSQQPWDYPPASRSSHLAQVLLEQLEVHEQAPLELPELSDPRAKRVAAMLRADPADRRPLAELALAAGASHRTIERLFATETRMSFGRWRLRHRMIAALEKLANGDNVGDVAYAVGYESPSSFIAAFRVTFGTTPTSYFENTRNGAHQQSCAAGRELERQQKLEFNPRAVKRLAPGAPDLRFAGR